MLVIVITVRRRITVRRSVAIRRGVSISSRHKAPSTWYGWYLAADELVFRLFVIGIRRVVPVRPGCKASSLRGGGLSIASRHRCVGRIGRDSPRVSSIHQDQKCRLMEVMDLHTVESSDPVHRSNRLAAALTKVSAPLPCYAWAQRQLTSLGIQSRSFLSISPGIEMFIWRGHGHARKIRTTCHE